MFLDARSQHSLCIHNHKNPYAFFWLKQQKIISYSSRNGHPVIGYGWVLLRALLVVEGNLSHDSFYKSTNLHKFTKTLRKV